MLSARRYASSAVGLPLALASLASLRRLCVNEGKEWTAEMLTVLCDPSHCKLARLKAIYLEDCRITAAHMQALAQLPALNELYSMSVQPDALPLLPSLPSLTSMGVMMVGAFEEQLTPATVLLPHLDGCALVKLDVIRFSFTEADLQALVVALLQLQTFPVYTTDLPLPASLSGVLQLRSLHIRRSPTLLN